MVKAISEKMPSISNPDAAQGVDVLFQHSISGTIPQEHLAKLDPETRKQLEKSDEERIRHINTEKFVSYPRADFILKKLEHLINAPKKRKPSCFLIVGESHNGKTSIVGEFESMHPITDGTAGDVMPVLYVLAPEGPDIKGFYDQIFEEILIPFKRSDSLSQKRKEIHYHFDKLGVRVLIIDEIHNILSGSVSKQKAFMNEIKNLCNKMRLPIVLVGTEQALYATGTDPQISSRFRPIRLDRWELDSDFLSLLASLETTLPLKKPSNIATTREIAEMIYDRSDGLIGDIVALITEAAILAIESKSEQITLKELKNCGFLPSDRVSRALTEKSAD